MGCSDFISTSGGTLDGVEVLMSSVRIDCDPHWQLSLSTEIGKKGLLFAKLQIGRARKRINAT